MPLYTAGQRIRGNEINSLPQLYRVTAPQICNNSAALRDVIGLTFQGDVNAAYLCECFLACHAHETGDIKFGWSLPAGSLVNDVPTLYQGSWHAVLGVDSASSGGNPGILDAKISATPATAIAKSGDNTDPCLVLAIASIQVGANAGAVKLQFAQNSAFAHDTTIRQGSCMRVTRQL